MALYSLLVCDITVSSSETVISDTMTNYKLQKKLKYYHHTANHLQTITNNAKL